MVPGSRGSARSRSRELVGTPADPADRAVPTGVAGAPDELVAGMPGVLLDTAERPAEGYSWRHGARWRAWLREGAGPPGAAVVTPDLEDAVIVAALDRRDRAAGQREGRAA